MIQDGRSHLQDIHRADVQEVMTLIIRSLATNLVKQEILTAVWTHDFDMAMLCSRGPSEGNNEIQVIAFCRFCITTPVYRSDLVCLSYSH